MSEENVLPDIGSEAWTKYWIDKLYPHEMTDKFPSTDGLRRLFRTYFARVTNLDMRVIEAPKIGQERATVQCVVTYYPNPKVLPLTLPVDGVLGGWCPEVISDVADCYWGNTKAPFSQHATATAATIAEGRCYRKAMFLRTMTQEEALNPSQSEFEQMNTEHEDNMPSTENQKNSIRRMCERIGIDIPKMMQYMNENVANLKTQELNNSSAYEAKAILQQLSKWQRKVAEGGEEVPEIIIKAKD